MIALFLLLVIVAIVLGIVGVVAKGLLYLLIIGIVVFLGALLLGALRIRRGPAGTRPGSSPRSPLMQAIGKSEAARHLPRGEVTAAAETRFARLRARRDRRHRPGRSPLRLTRLIRWIRDPSRRLPGRRVRRSGNGDYPRRAADQGLARMRRPLARRRRLPVTRPKVTLAAPLTASALCAILATLTGGYRS